MSNSVSPVLINREKYTLGTEISGTATFNTKNSTANVNKSMSLKLIYKSGDSKNPTSNLIKFIINLYKIEKLYVCKSNEGYENAFFCIDENDGIRDNTLTDFLDIKDIKNIKFVTNTQKREEYTFKIISNESIFKDYSYKYEIYDGKPLIEYYNLLEKEIQLYAQNETELKLNQPISDPYDFTNWHKSGGGRKKGEILYDNDVAKIWEEYIKENLLSSKIKTKEYKKIMNLFKKYISGPYNDNSNPEYNIMPYKDGLKHVNYFGLPLLNAYIKRYETMNDLFPSKIKNKIKESLKLLEYNREFKGGWGNTIMEPATFQRQPMQSYGIQQGETLMIPNPQMRPQMGQYMIPQMGQSMGQPMGQHMIPQMPVQQYINPLPIQVSYQPSLPAFPLSQPSLPPSHAFPLSQPSPPPSHAFPPSLPLSQPSQAFPLSQPFPPLSQSTTPYEKIKDVYRFAWKTKEGVLYRFNGFFYMKYDIYNNSGDSGDTTNSFRILCLNEYHKSRIGKNKDKNLPHTLIVANKITNVSKIYLCDKENLYKNIRRQSNNSMIAEILNETEQIYIFFEDKLQNVTEINLEPKYKNDFELLNYGIKKVVEEYKAITINSNIKEMFELYSKLEEQLEHISNSNNDIDTVIRLYKEELATRTKLCEIMLKNKNGTINEKINYYKTMLQITIAGISETIKSLPEEEQHKFINGLRKHSAELMKNIDLYGKYFIYFNEKDKKPSYFFGR
jgi:hypothetical protein